MYVKLKKIENVHFHTTDKRGKNVPEKASGHDSY